MTRILIAEQSKEVITFLKKQFKGSQYKVDVVENSYDAWKAIGGEQYDVLLVNIIMPGLDGFVMAQKALQLNPGMQILFITGFAAVAMDTYNTPAYAPQPMTSRPFHLREVGQRVKFYMGEIDLPFEAIYAQQGDQASDNVVYAEFGQNKG